MMFGNRLEITLRLYLEGNLHIGSGMDRQDERLLTPKDRQDGKKPPEVSEVQRFKDGNAVIPGTSLKGALRAQAPLGKAEFALLLGEQGEAREEEGRIGRLWLGAAIATPVDNGRFGGMTKMDGTRQQGFVKTAVRIDRKGGTGEDKLLYNREIIGEGVQFAAKATLFLDGAEETVLYGQFAHLLAPLAQSPGLLIGGQHRQAGGRLRLDEVVIERRTIDPITLDLTSIAEPGLGPRVLREAAATGPRAAHEAFRLTLTCDGPYISMRDKTPAEDDGREVTRSLHQPNGKPLLWPSSFLGALRSRAAWLAERERLRDNPSQPAADTLDKRDRVVRREEDIRQLSSVERLFGVAGWRGLLSIAVLEATIDCPIATQPMTSVTIDRFTGGGIDQRLFTEETFLNAEFTGELRLEDRARNLIDNHQRAADRALLELLFSDIQRRGLELGHGAAKGFGWFDVAVTAMQGGN